MTKEKKTLLDEALENMLSSLQDEQEMTEKQRRILESDIQLFAEKVFPLRFSPYFREIISQNLAREARLLAEHFISERIEEGEFRPLPTKAITHAIFSMMFGYVAMSKLFPEDFKREQVEQDFEQAVDILLHGIASKGS